MSTWDLLGIAPSQDEGAIRKAYAARVRQWRPDTHPKEFAALREAYEQALHWAREPEPDAAPDPVTELPEPVPHETPLPPAVAEAPTPRRVADAMVSELARRYSESGEREAVALLHEQYASLGQQTIDTRLEWELVLLQSLLGAATPPVVLLFEGDRLLRWRERDAEIARMFGDAAAQQLLALLEMAWEAMYGRHFSRNRWQARLFGIAPPHWFGWAPHVAAARRTAAWWRHAAQGPQLEGMLQVLHPSALRRMEGRMLFSTDVLFALIPAWLAWVLAYDPLPDARRWEAPGTGAILFLLVLPLPWLARWAWETGPAQTVRSWRYVADGMSGMLLFIVGAVLFGMGMVAVLGDTPLGVRIAGWVLVASMMGGLALFIAYWGWLCLRKAEVVVAAPWLWLQRCLGVHAFVQVRDNRVRPGWREWRQLPAVLAQGWKESRARRKQQVQRQALERQAAAAPGGGSVGWWWIVLGVVLLQGLIRLAK